MEALRTESMSVDPSTQPFEVVLKETEGGMLTGSKIGGSMANISVMSAGDQDPPTSVDHTTGGLPKKPRTSSFSEGTSHSKIQLLRKQLDENRTKFERRQRDSKEKKANMDQMKKKIEKLRSEVEQRDEFIQNLEKGIVPSHSQPTTQQLCQQLLQKDAIVMSLTARVGELESLCQDQTDQLGEKDSLIDARTEAVSLVTKDKDEKLLKMMEDMEENLNKTKELQQQFTEQEIEWKSKHDVLTRNLAEKSSRVAQLEESQRRTESVRFELAARSAELQEKIVALQTEQSELTLNLEEEKKKNKLSRDTIQDLKQKLTKAEAHGRNKLKNLEKQVKSMKSGGGQQSGQNILELNNQIAVLEEEKGNLQLRLVDFDDLKAINTSLEEQTTALRRKLDDSTKEINAKSLFISSLEDEKIKLVDMLNEREKKVVDLESISNAVQLEIVELKTSKDSLVEQFRIKEEETFIEKAELEKLRSETQQAGGTAVETAIIDKESQLNEAVSQLNGELSSLKEQHEQQQVFMKELKAKAEACEASERETAEANQRLLNILADKENNLTADAIEMDSWSATKTQYENQIDELTGQCERHVVDAKTSKTSHRQEVQQLQKIASDKEAELEALIREHRTEQDKMAERVKETQKLQDKLSDLQEQLSDSVEDLTDCKKRNSKLERDISDNLKNISTLKSDLQSHQDTIYEDKEKIKQFEDLVKQLKFDLESETSERKQLAELLKETENSLKKRTKELEELHKDLLKSEKQFSEVNSSLNERLEEVSCLSQEKESLLLQLREQEADAENKRLQIASVAAEISAKREGVSEQNAVVQMSASDADLIKQYYEDMETKLNMKETMLIESQNLVSSLTTERDTYVARLTESDAKIENWSQQFAVSQESEGHNQIILNDLQQKLTSEQQLRENLEINLLAEQKTSADLQNCLLVEQQSREEAQNSLTVEQKSRAELQSRLDGVNTQLAGTEEEIRRLNVLVAEKEELVAEVQRQLDVAAGEVARVQAQYSEASSYQQQVTENVAVQEQQLQWSNEQLQQIQNHQQASQTHITELLARVEALTSERDSKLSELQAQQQIVFDNNTQLQEKQNIIDGLQVELSSLRSQNETVFQQNQDVSPLQAHVSTLQTEIEFLKQNIASSSDELQNKTASIADFTAKNQMLESNLSEMQTSFAQKDSELQEYANNLRAKEELVSKLEAELAALKNQEFATNGSEALQQQLFDLQSDASVSQQRIADLERRVNEEVSTSETLRVQLQDKSAPIVVPGDAEHFKERCSVLEVQLEEASLKIAQLETSLGTVSSGVQTQTLSAPSMEEVGLGEVDLGGDTSKGGRASPELLGLQQALLEKTHLVEQIQEQLTSLKNSAHSQQEEMAWQNQKMNGFEETNKQLEARKDELQQQLLYEAEQNSNLGEKIVSLEGALSEVREQLANAASSHEQQVSSLEQQLQALNGALEAERLQRQHLETTSVLTDPSTIQTSSDVVPSTASAFFGDASAASSADWFSAQPADTQGSVAAETLVGDTVVTTATSDEPAVSEQSADANIAELQYKLSWYEEQWGPFTTLYNDLLQQHQEANAKITELSAALAAGTSGEGVGEARASTETPMEAPATGDVQAESAWENKYAELNSLHVATCNRVSELEAQITELSATPRQVAPVTEDIITSATPAPENNTSAASYFSSNTGEATLPASSFFSAVTDANSTESFFSSQPGGDVVQLKEELRVALVEKEQLLQSSQHSQQLLTATNEQLVAARTDLQQVQNELQLLQQQVSCDQ